MKYLPATNFVILHLTGKKDNKFRLQHNKSPNWWEKDSFFTYPYFLISAFYGLPFPNFREDFNIPTKNFELMGDSGGFSYYKKNINLDPMRVLEWHENNCDIGFSLDYPLVKTDNATDVKIKNKHSIKNILDVLPKRKNDKMEFYPCIHGWNEKQVIDYHKQIPDDQVQGYGIGECSATDDRPEGIISRILLEVSLNENKKRLHILGCCSPLMIGFLNLVEQKEGIELSYDSTAFSNGAMYRWYHLDGFKKDKHRITGKKKKYQGIWGEHEEPITTVTKLSCKCPVCSVVPVEEMKTADSEGCGYVCLHNLYHEIELDKQITKLSKEPNKLLKFLNNCYNDRNQYNKIIRLIKEYINMDTEKFIKRHPYNNKFNAFRNVQLETWLGDNRTELRMAEERLQKTSKKKKATKKAEIVKEEPKYQLKDEDWDI